MLRAEFNKNNDRIADIDALNNRTTYTVDKVGNRIAVTDALGGDALYAQRAASKSPALDPEGYLTRTARDQQAT